MLPSVVSQQIEKGCGPLSEKFNQSMQTFYTSVIRFTIKVVIKLIYACSAMSYYHIFSY